MGGKLMFPLASRCGMSAILSRVWRGKGTAEDGQFILCAQEFARGGSAVCLGKREYDAAGLAPTLDGEGGPDVCCA